MSDLKSVYDDNVTIPLLRNVTTDQMVKMVKAAQV